MLLLALLKIALCVLFSLPFKVCVHAHRSISQREIVLVIKIPGSAKKVRGTQKLFFFNHFCLLFSSDNIQKSLHIPPRHISRKMNCCGGGVWKGSPLCLFVFRSSRQVPATASPCVPASVLRAINQHKHTQVGPVPRMTHFCPICFVL